MARSMHDARGLMARDHRAHIDQNVATIASLREHAEEDLSAQQRGIESVTAALGQPRSIYVVIAVVLLWCGANVIGPRFGVQPFDPPPFLYLQGSIGFVALLTMIMVLTSQARQRKEAERNAHLDLQINLLAEQKITKLVALVEELRRDIPIVPNRKDSVAEVMTEPLDAKAVVTALDERLGDDDVSR